MSRLRFFLFPLLIIVLSLTLVACVRPLPESADTSPIPNDQEAPASQSEGQPTPTAAVAPSAPYPPAKEALGSELPLVDDAYPAEEAYPAAAEAADTTDEAAATEEPTTENTAEATENTEEAAPSGPIEHVVGSGQTLFSIGLLYNMSWVTLADYNNLTNPNSLSPGQTILIPTLEELNAALEAEDEPAPEPEAGTETETAVAEEAPAESKEHVVQTGENLYRIALQYGLSWVEIANANGLTDPTQVTVGQTLFIPVEQE